jgi:hypothetical protein
MHAFHFTRGDDGSFDVGGMMDAIRAFAERDRDREPTLRP